MSQTVQSRKLPENVQRALLKEICRLLSERALLVLQNLRIQDALKEQENKNSKNWNDLMKNCQPKAQSPLLIISFIMIFYKPIYLIKVILRVSLLSIVGVNTSYKGHGDSNTYYFLPTNFFELLNSHWLTIVILLVLRWGIYFTSFFFYTESPMSSLIWNFLCIL